MLSYFKQNRELLKAIARNHPGYGDHEGNDQGVAHSMGRGEPLCPKASNQACNRREICFQSELGKA